MAGINLNGRSVLIIGDSLSAGRNTPGTLLGQELQKWQKPSTVTVLGVGGMALSYFRPGYLKLKNQWASKARSQLAAAKRVQAQIIFIALGTNDYLSPELHVLAGASNLSDQLRKDAGLPAPEIYFLGPPSFDVHMRDGKVMKGINRFYRAMGLVYGAHLLDTRPQSADLLGKKYRPDDIHFTKTGAEIYAGRMAQLIQGVKMGPHPKRRGVVGVDWGFVGMVGLAYGIAKLLSDRGK